MIGYSAVGLKDVTLVRGRNTVFRGLTLKLNEPRIGLIGDNGAGRSSLFRLLCGLEMPSSGSVWAHKDISGSQYPERSVA